MRDIKIPKVDRIFVERWSTRQFAPETIPDTDLDALFEAARWAPSSFNAQPWLFVHSRTEEGRDRLASVLNERNAAWAGDAPHIAVLFSRKQFEHNKRENPWAAFDSGAAWMSLALQAQMLGYNAHAMAGFDAKAVYKETSISPDMFDALCVIALGRPLDPESETRTPRNAPETSIKQIEAL